MKNFTVNIIMRTLLITLLIAFAAYFYFAEDRVLRATYFLVFSMLAVWELVSYNNRTNRDLSTFLLSLLENDFTTTFRGERKGKSFTMLYDAMNAVTYRFRRLSIEKETRLHYLDALIEHVRIGLVSFDEDERIHLANDMFRTYAGVSLLNNLMDIDKTNPELLKVIRNTIPGQDQVIRMESEDSIIPLNIHATEFMAGDRRYTLVSLQNIRQALDRQETDSYQKLIRVLTHEIMNSVSPISSLSASLYQKVQSASLLEGDNLSNVEKGLKAIRERSNGLETFTEAYKQLTRLPQPEFRDVDLDDLIGRIVALNAASGIAIKYRSCGLSVKADARMLEQVLINLMTNARDAVRATVQPNIEISVERNHQLTSIAVSDNGHGIEEDKLDKIFVPFFTTKNDGSGIGLALSRQVMRLHGGTIEASSKPGQGSTFTLTL